MNTFAMPTRMQAETSPVRALGLTGAGLVTPPGPRCWLPAPIVERRPNAARPAQRRRGVYSADRGMAAERLMLALLGMAALGAIGYGFICLLNLVQNWAVFHAGVATLVQ